MTQARGQKGRLIAVVGPSGVGKDSLMAGLAAALPQLHVVRRVITRDAALGGEDFEPVGLADYLARRAKGEFILDWGAHGLFYGIPREVQAVLARGQDALVNLSRAVLGQAAQRFDTLHVLSVTARPETLAARLGARGREAPADVAARLARQPAPFPAGLRVSEIGNDGALSDAVAAAMAALQPQSAKR